MTFENFGRAGEGRLLGQQYKGENPVQENMNEALAQQAKVQAKEIAENGQIPTVVEYKTPQERAGMTAKRTAIMGTLAATLVSVLVPPVLAFVTAGDYSEIAIRTLVTSVITALLILALSWSQKYREATKEDNA